MSLLEWSIILPALLAGILVLSTHVPLGRIVLSRGIIFMDLAIAQVAGLGVVIAGVHGWGESDWLVQISAVSAALIAAVGLYNTEKLGQNIQEAVIGAVFIAATSISLLLLANDPHSSEHLKELLVGQILWVDYSDLTVIAVVSVFVLGLLNFSKSAESGALFYLLFAVSVTVSVQLVGVYLVFASLILPALATVRISKHSLVKAYITGLLGYICGLLLAAVYDLPAGPMIIIALTVCTFVVLFLSRDKSTLKK
jgi:zinc/manganese transport system permease protein